MFVIHLLIFVIYLPMFVYLLIFVVYLTMFVIHLLILVIYLPMFVLFDVWCDVPPDKDKCAREKIATLPLYHLITSDQDKCWPGHDGSCRKIGTAQNDYFDFCQTPQKQMALAQLHRSVGWWCWRSMLSGTILIHRVASSTQTFHQAEKNSR